MGTAPGSNFAVVGLSAWDDDADVLAGEVILPSGLAVLREDTENPVLSMPRDLNADLMIDDQDHARDYVVLPVTVRVAWQGKAGRRSFEMSTMFALLALRRGRRLVRFRYPPRSSARFHKPLHR